MGSPDIQSSQAAGAQNAKSQLTTLDKGVIGQYYQVESLSALSDPVARRLESVGMTRGSSVCVLNNKSHGTDIIRLRETRWALGRSITAGIQVRPLPGPPVPNHDLSPEAQNPACAIDSGRPASSGKGVRHE